MSTHTFSRSVFNQQLAVPHASTALAIHFATDSPGRGFSERVPIQDRKSKDGAGMGLLGKKLSSFRCSRGSRLKPARKGDGPERLRLRLLE